MKSIKGRSREIQNCSHPHIPVNDKEEATSSRTILFLLSCQGIGLMGGMGHCCSQGLTDKDTGCLQGH